MAANRKRVGPPVCPALLSLKSASLAVAKSPLPSYHTSRALHVLWERRSWSVRRKLVPLATR
eukprot:8358692-Lingulodinium_polyedra.AAC.1